MLSIVTLHIVTCNTEEVPIDIDIDLQPTAPDKQSGSSWRTWAILILAFSLSIAFVIYMSRHRAAIQQFIRSLGVLGPLVSVALYPVLGLSPIPADTLTLINGAVFGPVWGALVAWIGMNLASLVEYFIGMRISNATDFEEQREELPLGLGDLPADSLLFLLGGRMLTSTGSKIVSYVAGIYRVSLGRYLWTTALSTAFGAVVFALGGFGLLNFLQNTPLG